jgi:diphosphomevalonate decarboxylase
MITAEVSCSPNIALIKYMGKKDEARNIPDNASLSYTLDHLHTTVKLTLIESKNHEWDKKCNLNNTEKNRFLQHLDFLRNQFHCSAYFTIYSANNFPAGCGLASSASSFAALTQCVVSALGLKLSLEEIAALSRHGSGSSCRSFFSPWALWKEKEVNKIDLPYAHLIHRVIVVSKEKKLISSSEAHRYVKTSGLFENRAKRAETRLENLVRSFECRDWEKSYKIIWQEFWDMHALFETAEYPFGYMSSDALKVLTYLREYWQSHQDGPLITMDAGPNVHLLFREDQHNMAQTITDFFSTQFLVL